MRAQLQHLPSFQVLTNARVVLAFEKHASVKLTFMHAIVKKALLVTIAQVKIVE